MVDGSFHFDEALLPEGWTRAVRVLVRDGLVTEVVADTKLAPGDLRVALGLPGLPNVHSHAFQRGLAGLAEVRGTTDDSFWTWREVMYRFLDRIDPDALQAIAAMAYVEMLESGFTRVGEFHYLHHDRDGTPFADPAEMSVAIAAAAEQAGIALTHLPVLYSHGGFGGVPVGAGQRRFVHDMDGYAALLARLETMLAALPDARLGVAPHSLRAVGASALTEVAGLAGVRPIHIHVAEQMREVKECLAWSGQRPLEWLLDHAAIDGRWCLVHATHMTQPEIVAVAATGAVAGLCPITEANLGDGFFPASAFRAAGGRFGIGSDSNVLIDPAEELRWLEYGQRLVHRRRNVLADPGCSVGAGLLRGAFAGGTQALGGGAAGFVVGAVADFISLDPNHPGLFGRSGDAIADAFIFGCARGPVDRVWRRGREMVSGGRHHRRERIVARFRACLEKLLA